MFFSNIQSYLQKWISIRSTTQFVLIFFLFLNSDLFSQVFKEMSLNPYHPTVLLGNGNDLKTFKSELDICPRHDCFNRNEIHILRVDVNKYTEDLNREWLNAMLDAGAQVYVLCCESSCDLDSRTCRSKGLDLEFDIINHWKGEQYPYFKLLR